jgi:hypothetical protein
MMPSPPIHHRADTRHSDRLSPGSTPARVGPQDWPVVTPQIVSPNVRSARSPRHARLPYAIALLSGGSRSSLINTRSGQTRLKYALEIRPSGLRHQAAAEDAGRG